jgi:hypothetical protein
MSVIRLNFNTFEDGEEYQKRLSEEANQNLRIFFALLSSYWQSTVDGPSYARELKAMSIELARLRLALDDIRSDIYYTNTRSEFLYQVLTSVLFPQKTGAPNPKFDDLDFRDFLNSVLSIYFKGSIPDSMQKAAGLLVSGDIRVIEYYKEALKPNSGYDISDQFGFGIDVVLPTLSGVDVFLSDRNIRILLNIIRPAHTLYRLRFILKDEYIGRKNPLIGQFNKILDTVSSDISNYGYEDFRKFVLGIKGIDPLGAKIVKNIAGEDHSADF